MAGVKDNIAWKQNANWHGQICKMQKGKKGREEKKAKKTKQAWSVETKLAKNEKMKGAISTMNNWQANSFLLRVFCGLGAVNIFVDSDASETFYEATFNLQ